jgi:hypothetical protein
VVPVCDHGRRAVVRDAHIQPERMMGVLDGLGALSDLPGCLLKGSKHSPVPLRQNAQMRIAAKRSLVAKFAQEVTHARMILKIPRRQVRR